MTRTANELLCWGDLETTGLGKHPDEQTLEIALIVTDADLNIVDEFGPVVLSASEQTLSVMNDYVLNMHTTTGLLDRVAQAKLTTADVDAQLVEFMSKYFGDAKGSALFCGNSIRLDRAFIEKDFPRFAERLHYRQIDVSTIKELARLWNPDVYENMPEKLSDHTAMTDIRESIKELRYYRKHLFA